MAFTEETLDKIDHLIKSGQLEKAKKQLQRIALKKIPERLAVKTSDLMLRTGLFATNLKIFRPLIYDRGLGTNEEIKLRYAVSLKEVGAYHEAFKLFESCNLDAVREGHLYYAIALFSRWEYHKAIPHLQKYISRKDISGYQYLVGLTNLLQATIAEKDFAKATSLSGELEAECQKGGHHLLLANCLELKSQLLFAQKEYNGALQLLENSSQKLEGLPSKYLLIIKFWQVINRYAKDPHSKKQKEELDALRLESVKMGRWSLVRECDHYKAIFEKDEKLFLKVYFGTPFASYRKYMLEQFSQKIILPKSYHWSPCPGSVDENNILVAASGKNLRTEQNLKKGQVVHRLLQTLSSDFYVPFPRMTLFSYLFPQEYFDPKGGANRVSVAAYRLQDWFNEQEIPLVVRYKAQGYRLFFTAPYSIEVNSELETDGFDNRTQIENVLKENGPLSAREISEKINLPLRTLYRLLESLSESGKILSSRDGRKVIYNKS